MKTDDKEKLEKTASFLKEAFCIDGESNFESFNFDTTKMYVNGTFKLTDSKRNTFYVTISNPKPHEPAN